MQLVSTRMAEHVLSLTQETVEDGDSVLKEEEVVQTIKLHSSLRRTIA